MYRVLDNNVTKRTPLGYLEPISVHLVFGLVRRGRLVLLTQLSLVAQLHLNTVQYCVNDKDTEGLMGTSLVINKESLKIDQPLKMIMSCQLYVHT